MPTLSELNENSYSQLAELTNQRISNEPLYFGSIKENECFDFLCEAQAIKSPSNTPIKFSDQQTALIALLKANKDVLIPKDRQVGSTLAICIYLAHEAYFKHKRILIVGPGVHHVTTVLDKIKYMLEAIMARNNKFKNKNHHEKFFYTSTKKIQLWNYQFVKAACGIDDLRGETFDIIYFTEASYMNNSADWAGFYQC